MNAQQRFSIRPATPQHVPPPKPGERLGRPLRDEGPWPEPSYIDPVINGVIGSIQSHMKKGVPIT